MIKPTQKSYLQTKAQEKILFQATKINIEQLQMSIHKSKTKQNQLIDLINKQRQYICEQENSTILAQQLSHIDCDIRNSQLLSSVDLEKIRWLEGDQTNAVQILGDEKHIKIKYQQLEAEGKPAEKLKLIKIFKRKKQFLNQLNNLKSDSPLFVSHQRVLLKQFLDELRQWNRQIEQANQLNRKDHENQLASMRLKNSINSLSDFIRGADMDKGQ